MVVEATLPLKVYSIEISEEVKKLPKEQQKDFIHSAISEALSKARRMIYDQNLIAFEEIKRKILLECVEHLKTDKNLPDYNDRIETHTTFEEYVDPGLENLRLIEIQNEIDGIISQEQDFTFEMEKDIGFMKD